MNTIRHSLVALPRIMTFQSSLNWGIMQRKILAFAVFLCTALSILYILQTLGSVSADYTIYDFKAIRENLLNENKVMEIKLMESSSLSAVLEIIPILNLEKVGTVSYIQVTGGEIVVK